MTQTNKAVTGARTAERVDNFAGWKWLLSLAIQDTINANTADGIIAMSKDNLFQIVRFPAGGPLGTNARWASRQMFDEVIATLKPRYRKHIIGA